MPQRTVTEEELAALIRRVTAAARAYIRGDMRTYCFEQRAALARG